MYDDLEEQWEETPADPRDPGDAFIPEDSVYRHDPAGAHRERFAGLPIVEPGDPCADPWQAAWVLWDGASTDGGAGSSLADDLSELIGRVGGQRIQAIVVAGEDASGAPEVLAAHAHRLPRLRSVFLGFVEPEHWEISWIRQGDITPLLEAFPRLERLDVRGSDGLVMRPVRHEHLRVLRFECGGLPAHVVRAVGDSHLPGLAHLELWLGVEQYGGDSTTADLAGILGGAGLPALRRLGLRDSERQDEIASAVAAAPVVARLEALSLGMGVLTDAGAEALLSGQPLSHLQHLDLHHNYLSEETAARVEKALPTVTVDLSHRYTHDEFYVAVSE
ncbi:hypothetical protein Misp01_03190 [Microtetraspora sp. NBRC 13810]|uniref:STM4015 family protein n=1 Tax=Microtetraspora sp. NBRC 13810 TaxID=3030990 RepID=UPI0024A54F4F|nr:STM4015 family protein [Microtetraspora sp. NBRC 13810]GLW05189.1 hypothetical protein Misp01_03190 [Microtetraspora sp. NBRC 13810]